MSSLKLTAFLPDVLDPAADDVPPGLNQRLTGPNAGPRFPAGTEGGERRSNESNTDRQKQEQLVFLGRAAGTTKIRFKLELVCSESTPLRFILPVLTVRTRSEFKSLL